MQLQLKNKNLSSESLIILFSIACYWFYLSICFGYFLSKIFYNFFDEINKPDLSKSIQFRKKFNLENIKKFVISYILKFFENWTKRIGKKSLLVLAAIDEVIKALKISRNKFKSIFKFKYNFRQLKKLLPIFWEAFQIVVSLINEVFLVHSIIKFLIKWKQFILFLMSESVLITRVIYILYIILLSLFGMLLGFLLGVYSRKDDIYVFILLLLLKMLYNKGFDYDLLKPNKVDHFYKFSLKTIEQINPRPSRLILKQPDQIPLPFLIIEDPFVFIETKVLFDESINYAFELFIFYRNVNQKVDS
jgi:hypothetical protein